MKSILERYNLELLGRRFKLTDCDDVFTFAALIGGDVYVEWLDEGDLTIHKVSYKLRNALELVVQGVWILESDEEDDKRR